MASVKLLATLTRTPGKWVAIQTLFQPGDVTPESVGALWEFALDFDSIQTVYAHGTLWAAFADDEPPLPETPETTYDLRSCVLEALSKWQHRSLPPLRFQSIADPSNNDSWAHLLARKGDHNTLTLLLEHHHLDVVLLLNKHSEIPADIGGTRQVRNLLKQHTAAAVEKRKEAVRLEIETLIKRLDTLHDEALSLHSTLTKRTHSFATPLLAVTLVGLVVLVYAALQWWI